MPLLPPSLLLDFSDQPGWSEPLGSEVVRRVLSEAGRFCLPQGDPLALWGPVAGAPAVIACEVPGWGPQVACEYLRQILQRFEAANSNSADPSGTTPSPRVLGVLAWGRLDPAAEPETRIDIERALAWLRSEPLRAFARARNRRSTRAATGSFLAWLRADRSRELLFPADAHAERWQELSGETLLAAKEATPAAERVAVDAPDWVSPDISPAPASPPELRIGLLLAVGPEGEFGPLPGFASGIPAALASARIAARIRVESATPAGLTRLARGGCDLLIWCGDCTASGRFPGTPRPLSATDLANDPALAPLWRGLLGCVVLGAHGERFAQGLPGPWLATPTTSPLEANPAFLPQLFAPLANKTWVQWAAKATGPETLARGGDWPALKVERGETRLEFAPPQWQGTAQTELAPGSRPAALAGREASLRRLWRGVAAPAPSVVWINATPGAGVSHLLAEHARRVAQHARAEAAAPVWLLHIDCQSAVTSSDLERLLCERAATLYSSALPRATATQSLASLLPAVAALPGTHAWILDHVNPGATGPGSPLTRVASEARRLGWPVQLVVGSRQAAPADFDSLTLPTLTPGDLADLFHDLAGPHSTATLPAWSELTEWSRSGAPTTTLRGLVQWRAWNAAGPAPLSLSPGEGGVVADPAAQQALTQHLGFDSTRYRQLVWPLVRRAGSFTPTELAQWVGEELAPQAAGQRATAGVDWSRGLERLADLGLLARCRGQESAAYTLPPHQIAAAVRAADPQAQLPEAVPARAPQLALARLTPLLDRPDPAILAQVDALASECRRSLDTPESATTLARLLRWQANWFMNQPGGTERARSLNEELISQLGARSEAVVLEQVAGAVLDQARGWSAAGDLDRARELLTSFVGRLEGRTEPGVTQALAAVQAELGAVLVEQGRASEALPLLERALAQGSSAGDSGPAPFLRRAELAKGLALVAANRTAEGQSLLSGWLQVAARDAEPLPEEWLAAAHAGLGRACALLADRTGAATHYQWVADRLATRTEPRLVARAAAALQSHAELVAEPQPAQAVALLQKWLERYGDHAAPAVRALLPGSLLTLARAATAVGDTPAFDTACSRLLNLAPAGDPGQVGQTATILSTWVSQLVARDSAPRPAGWSGRVRDWFRHNESAAAPHATATRFAIANWLAQGDSPAAALTAWEELLGSQALQAATALPVDLARARTGRASALELGGRVPEARSAWGTVVDLLAPDSPPEVVELVASALDRQTALFAPATTSSSAPGAAPATESAGSLATALRQHHQQVLQRVEPRSEPRFARAIAKALAALGGESPDGPTDPTAHDRLIERFASDTDGEVRGEVVAALVARAERAEARADAPAALEAARRATTLGADLAGERSADLVRRGWLVSALASDRLGDLVTQSTAVSELARRTSEVANPEVLLPVQRAQVSLARRLVAAGRHAEAISVFDGVLAQPSLPGNREADELAATALLERGLARVALGEVEAALGDLGAAATRWAAFPQPTHAEPLARALHAQVTLLQQQGDLDGEAQVREQLVEAAGPVTDPAVAQWVALALVQSAEMREKLSRRSEVSELLERVLARHTDARDPRLLEPVARALLIRAFNHLRLGNLPAALESANQVRAKFGTQTEPALVETARRAEGLIHKVEQILQAVQMDADALPTTAPVPPSPSPPSPPPPTKGTTPPATAQPSGKAQPGTPVSIPTAPTSASTPPPVVPDTKVAPPAATQPAAKQPTATPAAPKPVTPTPTAGTTPDKSVGPAAAPSVPPAKRPPAKPGAAPAKGPKEPAPEAPAPQAQAVPPESPASPAPPVPAPTVPAPPVPAPTAPAPKAPAKAAPTPLTASPVVEAPTSPAAATGATPQDTAATGGPAAPQAKPDRKPVKTSDAAAQAPPGPAPAAAPAPADRVAVPPMEETEEFQAHLSRPGAAGPAPIKPAAGAKDPADSSATAPLSPAEARSLLEDTKLLREAGDRQGALQRYAQVQRQFAQDSSPDGLIVLALAELGIATMRHQAGESAAARAACDQLRDRLAKHPEPTVAVQALEAQLLKASFLHADQQADEELRTLDEAIVQFRDRREPVLAERVAHALLSKGSLLGQLGNQAGSIAAFDELVERYQGATEVPIAEQVARGLTAKAVRLLQARDPAGHAAALEQVLRLYGDRTEAAFAGPLSFALFSKALRSSQAGDVPGSLALYEQVITRYRDHSSPETDEWIAKSLFNRGVRLPALEAIPHYDEVVSRFGEHHDPGMGQLCVTALVNKGVTLGQLGRLEEELQAYDEAVRRYGDRREPAIARQAAKALVSKGNSLRRANRQAEAIAAFSDLLIRFAGRTEPVLAEQLVRGLVGKASALGEAGDTRQALEVYDSVLQRFGTQTDKPVAGAVAVAVLYKAVVLESLGDTPGALSWLKKHAARLTALTDQYAKEWQALRKKLGL